jgi:Putative beta-lactamase-inhibitor-like, PepSY-like
MAINTNMKKTILMGIMAFVALTSQAQKTSIPEVVKAKVTSTYPKATGVKFEKEGKDFEAGFKNEGKDMSILMDGQGNILETETDITVAELPKNVKEYLAKNMKGKKIKEAATIVDAKGMKKFEAEIGGKDYLFDEKGNLLKK